MDSSDLQARIDAAHWYHEFDFGNGLTARSRMPDVEEHRRVWRFIRENLDTVDFKGKSVLDIGCWDGFWSFYAEERGARRVLATDDHTQNWSARRGVHLAKELLGSAVEVNDELSVYGLAALDQKFDIILFLGVYYHLFDPFYALAQIRHCCHADTILLVEGPETIALPAGAARYDLADHACEWLPTPDALRQLLCAAYFNVVSVESGLGETEAAGLPGRRWRLRLLNEVLKDSREGVRRMAAQLCTGPRRTFIRCAPLTGENPVHFYRPPFDLHQYDPRFSDG